MLTYRTGAAGARGSAAKMADHLLEQTLPILARDLAAYYQRGVHAGPHDGTVPEVRRDMDPAMAALLKLDPNRTPNRDEIAHVLAGQRADGEAMPGQARQVAYIDLCFSADKSVALAWAFAPTEAERNAVAQAHRDAVEAAMAYVAAEIGQARRGKAGRDGVEPGQVGWIAFDHYASRPTVEVARLGANGIPETELVTLKVAGDPNLHTHVAVPNAVLTASGRVGSLDLQRLDGRIHEFGAYYQAHLAQNLRRLGVETRLDERTGAARLPVIPDTVRDAFSKRTRDAEDDARAYARRIGRDWDMLGPDEKVDLLKGGAFASRRAKADDLSDFAAWTAQAKALGWSHAGAMGEGRSLPELEKEARHAAAYEASLPVLEDELWRRAVLQGSDARVAAARGLIAAGVEGPADIDAVTRLYRERGVRQDGSMVGLLWGEAGERGKVSLTTTLHVDQERELVRLAQEAARDMSGALSPEQLAAGMARSGLAFDGPHGAAQRAAMERLGQAGSLSVTIGAAGTGKTTLLRPLVDAWQAEGRTVHGVALAWRQSTDLANAGIPKGQTRALMPFLRAAERGDLALDRTSVVVVDELGLLGTAQMLELLRLREHHGFQLAAVGDPLQCQSIEAGPVITLLREALGREAVPELLTTIRQQTEREREITALLREGSAEAALALKREDGTAELVAGGYAAAVGRVAALWWERRHANRDDPGFTLSVSAPTNADAREIGASIRSLRQAAGEVGARPDRGRRDRQGWPGVRPEAGRGGSGSPARPHQCDPLRGRRANRCGDRWLAHARRDRRQRERARGARGTRGRARAAQRPWQRRAGEVGHAAGSRDGPHPPDLRRRHDHQPRPGRDQHRAHRRHASRLARGERVQGLRVRLAAPPGVLAGRLGRRRAAGGGGTPPVGRCASDHA